MREPLRWILITISVIILGFSFNRYLGPIEEPRKVLAAEEWKEQYPNQYNSYLKNSNIGEVKYGGEQQINYIEKYSNIKVLYEGMGFSKEYFSARGHTYALEDVIKIARPKPGATCLACKTASYEGMLEEHGTGFWKMDFDQMAKEAKYPVTCYSCHRNEPGTINLTNPHTIEALKLIDREVSLKNQSCAQCHVEYYFNPKTLEVVLPWKYGTGVRDMERYFDEIRFSDWIHPRTKTPLIKIQHPEFEMFSGSIHDRLNISCVACHMPQMKDEKGHNYSSHWWTSPLKTIEQSCLGCHQGTAEDLEGRVIAIQDEIETMQKETSDLLVELIEKLALATKDNLLSEAQLNEIRILHRSAQIRWDFIFAENSTGFHNSEKAREYLKEAQKLAKEAIMLLQ
jgi:nitrite reductase (cytochrome c-552)